MKRTLLRIRVCLALGVVTTVGVAWGLAWSGNGWRWADFDTDAIETPTQPHWRSVSDIRFGAHDIYLSARASIAFGDEVGITVPTWSRGRTPPTQADVGRSSGLAEYARGWPALSNLSRVTFRHEVLTGIEVSGPRGPRYLPTTPIFPGFIINTLFYSATWFVMLFLGFTRFKRAIRKKRGRCPDCRYDLRGDLKSGCPECGWNRRT